jgi:hypothetical protein
VRLGVRASALVFVDDSRVPQRFLLARLFLVHRAEERRQPLDQFGRM